MVIWKKCLDGPIFLEDLRDMSRISRIYWSRCSSWLLAINFYMYMLFSCPLCIQTTFCSFSRVYMWSPQTFNPCILKLTQLQESRSLQDSPECCCDRNLLPDLRTMRSFSTIQVHQIEFGTNHSIQVSTISPCPLIVS